MQNSQNRCRAKVGLIFLRDCNKPVDKHCPQCGTPICAAHGMETSQGWTCQECAARDPNARMTDGIRRVRRRNDMYDRTHYYPFFYSSGYYYSRRDYDTMDHDGWDDLDTMSTEYDASDELDPSLDDEYDPYES